MITPTTSSRDRENRDMAKGSEVTSISDLRIPAKPSSGMSPPCSAELEESVDKVDAIHVVTSHSDATAIALGATNTQSNSPVKGMNGAVSIPANIASSDTAIISSATFSAADVAVSLSPLKEFVDNAKSGNINSAVFYGRQVATMPTTSSDDVHALLQALEDSPDTAGPVRPNGSDSGDHTAAGGQSESFEGVDDVAITELLQESNADRSSAGQTSLTGRISSVVTESTILHNAEETSLTQVMDTTDEEEDGHSLFEAILYQQEKLKSRLQELRRRLAGNTFHRLLQEHTEASTPSSATPVTNTIGSLPQKEDLRSMFAQSVRFEQQIQASCTRKRKRGNLDRLLAEQQERSLLKRCRATLDPYATDCESSMESDSEGEEEYVARADEEVADHAVDNFRRCLRKCRKLQADWDHQRSEIGWRWNWLKLRTQFVDEALDECKDALGKIRADKSEYQSDHPVEESSARERGYVRSTRRKIIRVAVPQQLQPKAKPIIHGAHGIAVRARAAAFDRSFHPVLSMFESMPKWLRDRSARRSRLHVAKPLPPAPTEQSTVEIETSTPPASTNHQHQSSNKKRSNRPSSAHRRTSSLPSSLDLRPSPVVSRSRLNSVDSPCSTPNQKIKVHDIDNIVIPAAYATTRVELREVKEILTPSFREVNLPSGASAGLDEDLSDEAFKARHSVSEKKERERFLAATDMGAGRRRTSSMSEPTSSRRPSGGGAEDQVVSKDAATPPAADSSDRDQLATKFPEMSAIPGAWAPRKFPLSRSEYNHAVSEQTEWEEIHHVPILPSGHAHYTIVQNAAECSKPDEGAVPRLKLVLKLAP